MQHGSSVGTEAPPCVPMSVLSSCIASILRRSIWRLVFPSIDTRCTAYELHPLQRLVLKLRCQCRRAALQAQTVRPPKDKAWRYRRLYACDARLLSRACGPRTINEPSDTMSEEGAIISLAWFTTRQDDTSVHTRDKVVLLQVLLELSSLDIGVFDAPYHVCVHFWFLYLSPRYLLYTLDNGYTASTANRHG